jgi:hypothetical protein
VHTHVSPQSHIDTMRCRLMSWRIRCFRKTCHHMNRFIAWS